MLAFTTLISIATGVLFGLAPAFQISQVTHDALKEGGRGATAGRVSQQLRRVLVAAEIALSLVLLTGSGLLLKSFARLMQVDPGFRPEGVLTMRLALPNAKYPSDPQIRAFYRELADRVSRLPGSRLPGWFPHCRSAEMAALAPSPWIAVPFPELPPPPKRTCGWPRRATSKPCASRS